MDPLERVDEWGPEKVVCVSDRRTGMRGVLVIDNTALGMGKGGTRMAPAVTVEEISRLARVMTWKWAAVELGFGGAKAGIRFDPDSPAKERVLRAFVRALRKHVPSEYVFGLDLGLNERDAAIVLDELGDAGAAVGTPAELGGMPYDQLGVTGFGVAECAEVAVQRAGFELVGASVALQGFGAVGHAAARRLAELGARIVSVSTSRGMLYDPDGLDVDLLLKLRAELGDDCVRHYDGGTATDETQATLPVDVFIPAALQDVIDERTAAHVRAKVIVEGANLPTSPAAQALLRERGIVVVPDFIANAGGVIAAAFAMDARYSPFQPQPDAVFPIVSGKLRDNAATVIDSARREGVTTHRAAFDLARHRVATAMRLKGRITDN
jgi:glutamate dehydrogenase (NAD(P)+)